MSRHPGDELFPLPLTVFEQYMLADDRPAYPMTFFIRIRLAGDLGREAFLAAVDEALPGNPLLWALVDRRTPRGPCWVRGASPQAAVDWAEGEVPLTCPRGPAIDLACEPGLRVWVRHTPQQSRVTFQFHHAACDGIAALRWIGEVLARYARRTASDGMAPIPAATDMALLPQRGRMVVKCPEPVTRWQALRATVVESARWLLQRPAPLAVPASRPGVVADEFPGMHGHTFDVDATRGLRSAAVARGVSLNDLALRDLFLTLRDWNTLRRPGRPGRWLRINMPQNLRDRDDERMPAANRFSHTFLTRRTAACDDPQGLLASIHSETEAIKRWNAGNMFLGGIGVALQLRRIAPPLYAWGSRGCHATAVLTNVGEIARRLGARFPTREGRVVAGNVVLEELLGVPPGRDQTRAALAMLTYAGRLSIVLRCDPHLFPAAESRELLARYVARLAASGAAAPPAASPRAAHRSTV